MKKRRLMIILSCLTAGAIVLTGCSGGGSSGSSDGTPVSGGDLVMARSEDPEGLLPAQSNNNPDIWTEQQIFDTLTRNKVDGSGVEPGLASEWSVSDDQLTWKFKIRPNVKFSNGTDLTIEDVVWSLNYAREAREDKLWTDLFTAITDVKAAGDDTVELTLSQPWAPLPADLALFAAAIYPANFGGQSEKDFREHPIGTGPFKLDEWKKGEHLKLAKNEHYWEDGLPHLDSVTFKTVSDDNTRQLQLQGNQVQINEGLDPASVKSLEGNSKIQLGKFQSTEVNYIALNSAREPFKDSHVRRALTMALDRDAVTQNVYHGVGKTATTFLSDGLWGHDPSIEALPYDIAKAKEELKQSSFPDGFKATILVQSGMNDRQQVAQIAQEAWKELGVQLDIQVMDGTAIMNLRRSGDYDMMTSYVTSDITDPDQMINFLVTTGNTINTGYSNTEVDRLAQAAVKTDDQNERTQLYSDLQKQVTEDAPLILTAYTPSLFAMSSAVHGFQVSTVGTYTLKDTWLSK
ncbi:ABC transporter substrate-binding protein [Pseudoclavibacter sp. CFCC 13796]|uniref:ABC transporter substrate-binding protein n=1 Tax=Pseudoclavibacter sp. CFCC 13796 TaxID=2615179 RepID=UPI001300ECC9|nr:ABC transporter substrate-binding protein [Pseudoclavibacter sp. CFCC 13796]KAB1660779.1 ABC transporter substrate-binding protein [Pseudoclavibacter sp. CFCC 13796]